MYAYGVVLLELLTGRPAVDGSRPNGCQLLAQWLLPSLSSVTRLWVSPSPGLRHCFQPLLWSAALFCCPAPEIAMPTTCSDDGDNLGERVQ